MKPRVYLTVIAVATGVVLAWWLQRRSAPVPPPKVTIQDGKTIDFSSGKPVVKDTPGEKAIIAAAVKEMDEAAKGVKFGPTAPPSKKPKTPEPSPDHPPGK